ncbi:MAG: PH domain-containing protein [Dehalococcoidia bacterium]|nr:PH domain-containing protein [Dehalococcoidia bacterium]
MDSLIHQDKPRYDIWMKAIIALPLFFFLIGAFYLASSEPESAIGMFATAVLMAAVYWAVFPRKYRIFDSKVRIVLGGPFSFNIPFNTIETARVPEGLTAGINFASSFSSKNAVQIVRRKGLNVNITPSNRELFLENLDKALSNWRSHSVEST